MHSILPFRFKRVYPVLLLLGLGLLTACAQPATNLGDQLPGSAGVPTLIASSPTTTSSATTSSTVSPELAKYLGHNLLINGDAEAGTAATTEQPVVSDVPGWTKTGSFTVHAYVNGTTIGGVGDQDPRPDDHGKNFFTGGPTGGPDAHSSATQTIDLTPLASLVDANQLSYTLAGHLGGWGSYSNQAQVQIEFLDANQKEVAAPTQIGPVKAGNNGKAQEATGMWPRSVSQALPKGTRALKVTLSFSVDQKVRVAANPTENSAFADSLSLVLKNSPVS